MPTIYVVEAEIDIKSQVGKGTEVTVLLKKKGQPC